MSTHHPSSIASSPNCPRTGKPFFFKVLFSGNFFFISGSLPQPLRVEMRAIQRKRRWKRGQRRRRQKERERRRRLRSPSQRREAEAGPRSECESGAKRSRVGNSFADVHGASLMHLCARSRTVGLRDRVGHMINGMWLQHLLTAPTNQPINRAC